MFDVKIKVLKRCIHYDLIKEYENPLTNPCEMIIGDEYISINGKKPEGFCNNAFDLLYGWYELKPSEVI